MAKLPSKDAYVAIKSFFTTGLLFSLVSCSCVYYNLISIVSNLIIYSITFAIWIIFTKFAYKNPYGFQVIIS